MKKLLLMMCVMLIPLSGWAQDSEPYTLFDHSTGTATFEYGILTDEDKQKYIDRGFTVFSSWDYYSPIALEKVIFSASCIAYTPTSLRGFFYDCGNLTDIVGIQYLNTSEVTDMSEMFYLCKSLTSLDLSNFRTRHVTDMKKMFEGCRSLTSLDLSNFYTSNVTDMKRMFSGCSSLTSLDLSHFDTSSVTDMLMMFEGCGSLTSLDLSNFNTSNVTDMLMMFFECRNLTSLDVSNFNTRNVKDMHSMFGLCSNLTSLDVSNFNTNNVANLCGMFESCSSLTSLDLSNFNTRNVTDMYGMFSGCSSLVSLDLSNFNTSNVTNMGIMFSGCSSLTSLDVSNFNTSNVTYMGSMFSGCSSLVSLDVSNFNTSNVTDMSSMFSGCSSLVSLDVSNFNTSNVTDMSSMFSGCSSLASLDVSNFNTGIVSDEKMYHMFYGCSNLETIYCNDTWGGGAWYWNMFGGCEKLKGGHGTTYSAENNTSAFAHPNVGGYFTSKGTTFSSVTIGTSVQYWSSFYTDTRNVKADENTTVYTATLSSDGKELTLNEIADKIIPCGQAVLMKSTVKEPMLVTASSEGTGDYTTNSLQGTQVDIPTSSIEGTVYTLANEKGEFGYFRYTGETLKGGKAYLAVPGGSLARIIIAGLGDDATGIERIGTADSQAPSYDLQGRRVSQTQKGVYIINGKKVVK